MRIWHVNVGNHAGPVDGVAVISTQLARDQAALGHAVRLVVAAAPEHHPTVRAAAGDRVTLSLCATAGEARRSASALLDDPATRPDVLHLHSVFRPVHRLLAGRARRLGVPVVLSPHSGLAPELLARDRLRKAVYGRVVERRFHRTADGVHALQLVERDDVHRYCGDASRRVEVVANPFAPALADASRWTGRPGADGPPRAVMLSRFDVYQKGLDRVVALATALPAVAFDIYGHADKNAPAAADALRAAAPPNVRFLAPVHGDDKLRVLREADLFLQPSRVEGLSVALVEAMTLGVPCAVSGYVGRSLDMHRHGTALVLDDAPAVAAVQLAALLADRPRGKALGAAAARYAARHFAPAKVAAAHLAHYARLTGAGAPARDDHPPGGPAVLARSPLSTVIPAGGRWHSAAHEDRDPHPHPPRHPAHRRRGRRGRRVLRPRGGRRRPPRRLRPRGDRRHHAPAGRHPQAGGRLRARRRRGARFRHPSRPGRRDGSRRGAGRVQPPHAPGPAHGPLPARALLASRASPGPGVTNRTTP